MISKIATRAILWMAFLSALPAQTEYLVGLPAKTSEPTRKVLAKSVIDLVVGASAGDRFVFLNAQDLQRVLAFERPEARSKRSVLRRLRSEFTVLGRYLQGTVSDEAEPSLNAIRHPQLLTMMGELRDRERTTRYVVFGSAFYNHPSDPSFAMGGGLYPSDAHLGAAPSASIYSCRGQERSIAGGSVTFCYLREAFENSFERDAVRRWWTVFVTARGGVLAHISASAPDAVDAALRGSTRPAITAQVDDRDQVIEMRRAGARVPVQPRSRLEEAVSRIPLPATGKFTVAACWPVARGSRVDVDIYLQARPGGPEISFRRKRTEDGRLLRDVQSGGEVQGEEDWRSSFEVVEVNETLLRGAKAWLNLYSYSGPGPIEGLVRVAVGSRHVDVPFAFRDGVQGNGTELEQGRRANSPHWIEIDLAAAFDRLEAQR